MKMDLKRTLGAGFSFLLLAFLLISSMGVSSITRLEQNGTQLAAGIGEYEWTGTVAITIDDGFLWTYTDLLDTIADINSDSGLVNTPFEMHFTVSINVENGDASYGGTGNGLRDRYPLNTTILSSDEVRELHSSRLAEVGLHGYMEGVHDPSSIQSPWGVHGAGWNQTAGNRDSTSYSIIVDGVKALRDTILNDPNSIVSYVTNGHRLDGYSMQLAAKMGIRNIRAGTIMNPLSPTNGWPPDKGTVGTTLYDRGMQRELNRFEIDRFFQWWNNYSSTGTDGSYAPFYPLHRLWMAHQAPPVLSNATANKDSTKSLLYRLAESHGFGILVWHDLNVASGSNNVGGMAGVGEVLRYAAGLCNNARLMRDAPGLQVLTLAEASAKVNNWRLGFAGQSISMVDNWNMIPSLWNSSRPFGYPDRITTVWSDSGWAYEDSAGAAGNGLVGINGETGLVYTTAADRTGDPHGLIMVTPVVPGGVAYVNFYASAETMAVVSPASYDSCEAAHFTIGVQYYFDSFDATDSTAAWLGGGEGSLDVDTFSILNSVFGTLQFSANTGNNKYTRSRQIGPFHTTDQWTFAQGTGAGFGNYWYDGAQPSILGQPAYRWREFRMATQVPDYARAAKWILTPVGFGTGAQVDTLCVAGFDVNCTVK